MSLTALSAAGANSERMGVPRIAVVDLSACSVDQQDWDPSTCVREAQQIIEAFTDIGFVYLTNCISQQQVDHVNHVSKRLFDLPTGIKQKYARAGSHANQGWVGMDTERLNPKRPTDLKECYNCTPAHKQVWPDKELPEFRTAVNEFQKLCQVLALRVLTLIAVGLGLEPTTFAKEHVPFDEGSTTLRCLYYPALPPDVDIQKYQVRCGEHSDFGAITLLFQDNVGGLEVFTRDNQWVPATPIPGAVLVNVADLMQRWTADVLVSTPHRVLIPDCEASRKDVRQSLAFFVHPRDACIVQAVDGSNKYPAVSAVDYLNARLAAAY